jgi:hypothetical protein
VLLAPAAVLPAVLVLTSATARDALVALSFYVYSLVLVAVRHPAPAGRALTDLHPFSTSAPRTRGGGAGPWTP